MGPRSGDRGNIAYHTGMRRGEVLLQWGRDQVIAEMHVPALDATSVASLQWGRDQVIAEIAGRGEGRDEGRIASMGPRSGDRGNLRAGAWLSAVHAASMGPR